MQQQVTQGIILKSILYREKERILTVYTLEHGLMQCIVKGLSAKKSHLFALSTPLSFVELHTKMKNPDWLILQDGKVLDPFLKIRSSLELLQAASEIAKIVSDSHLPKVSSPKIFDLLLKFFKYLPEAFSPETLMIHLLFKILIFEGLVHFSPSCQCKRASFGLQRGESLCIACAEPGFWDFKEEEWQQIQSLIQIPSYSTLKTTTVPKEWLKKTQDFYYDTMHVATKKF